MWSPRSFDEALTDKQAALADVITGEGTSIMAELALGNEHFARELLDADASIVEKLLNRIAEVKEALARRKDAAAKEAFEELRVAEGAFLEALAEKGMRFEGGKIIGANEDDENSVSEDVDKSRKSRYNKRQYTPQDMDSITRESYNHHAWATNEIFGCLEPGEIGEFNSIISKINNGDYDPHKAYNGRLLIGVGRYKFGEKTTIILTDGNYESPSIDAVYKIITDKEETTKKVKEFIYARATKVQNGRMGESFEAYGYNDDEPYFWEYYLENGADFEAFDRQRARRKENGGDNEASEAGENNLGRVKPIRRIHYDDKSGILTTYYKDGSKYVEYSSADKKVKKSRKTVTATPPEVDHLTPMQKQTVANHTRAKVYTKAEALAVVEDMAHFLDENYGFDGGMGEASGFVTLTKTVKEALARRKDAAAKEAFAELLAAEGAFLEALAEKGLAFVDGKIIGADEEDDEISVRDDVDKEQTTRYNKKRYAP